MIPTELWSVLPVPVLMIDAQDRIIDANPAAETLLNQSVRTLRGQDFATRMGLGSALRPAWQRMRAQSTALTVSDVDCAGSQGSLSAVPLEEGVVLVTLHLRTGAARLVQSGHTARSARSAIGMADMLAHEIKNPLAGITGAAQLLSMGLPPQDQELTDLIVAESRRIVGLLDQVEAFGNQIAPTPQAVNLHDALDRAQHAASVGFGRHMAFQVEYDPSLPPASVDPDQLQQVLLNLLKNASEASPKGGVIRLRTYYDAGLRVRRPNGDDARLPLQVELCDDGPGLPDDIRDQVFDPFVSGRENGTGLGLALVSKLMRDNGGWIDVTSAPGATCFRLAFARYEEG